MERLNEREIRQTNTKLGAKSKDRNFRIMKKQIMDKKMEIESMGVGIGFGPMIVTGLSHQPQMPMMTQAPVSKPSRNRTTPKFH